MTLYVSEFYLKVDKKLKVLGKSVRQGDGTRPTFWDREELS
jgi:hypothetical protein